MGNKMRKNRKLILTLLPVIAALFTISCMIYFYPSSVSANPQTTMPSYGAANLRVVDISQYNDSVTSSSDNINFTLLKTQVDAVYIRALGNAGSGLYIDKQAANYAAAAQANDLKFGFYLYFVPTASSDDTKSQARSYYNFIKNYSYSCIPALDVENNDNGLTKAQLAASVKIFADEFKALSGLDLMIYTYPYFMSENFDTSFNWSAYKLWIAHYNVSQPMEGISSTWMPSSKWCWSYWDMWQFTSTGTLSSIPNSSDGHLDISYATDNILLAAPTSAEIESIIIPANASAGKIFSAEITVKNTDKVAWTEGTDIRLGVTGTISGSNRVLLPDGVSVAPGASYTFIYTASAPESGDLVMTVQMLKEGVVWFGEAQTATVKATGAKITAVASPQALMAGQTQNMQITIKNTGLMSWTAQNAVRLGIGYNGSNGGRVHLPDGVTITRGESYTFTYAVTAPSSGNMSLSFQMVQDGVAWFGAVKSVSIPVKAPTSAVITSITLPDNIKAGSAYTASITVKNTDKVTWTKVDKIRLGVVSSGTGSSRVYLPLGVSVAPGQSYTFTYKGTAPTGTDLVLKVQMLKEGLARFGESQTATVKARDAQIVSVTAPAALLAGQTQNMQITVRNTGLMTWTPQNNFRLGLLYNGADGIRVSLPADITVKPGQNYTFTYAVTAQSSGNLSLTIQMVQDGVAWFGEAKAYPIPVKNSSSAEITAIIFSENMTAGGDYTASITVKNTDNVTWTRNDKIRLGVQSNGAGASRAYLPTGVSVAPGASYTFTYKGTAPASGDLTLAVQMIQEGVVWFGESETAVVKALGAQIVSTSAPQALLPGQTQNMQVTVKNTGLMSWTSASRIRLGIINAAGSARVILPSDVTVAPGQSYTFTYAVTAPASGSLLLDLQMLQEGIAWFGDKKAVSIPVKNPSSAEITAVTLSDNITAGMPYTASITVTNTDTVIWTRVDNIRLGVAANGTGSSRAYLPAGVSVDPGGTYTFTYTATAPAGGQLTLTVQMIQEGIVWFGQQKTISSALFIS